MTYAEPQDLGQGESPDVTDAGAAQELTELQAEVWRMMEGRSIGASLSVLISGIAFLLVEAAEGDPAKANQLATSVGGQIRYGVARTIALQTTAAV